MPKRARCSRVLVHRDGVRAVSMLDGNTGTPGRGYQFMRCNIFGTRLGSSAPVSREGMGEGRTRGG